MAEPTQKKKKVNRNTYLFGGIALGVLAYVYWRHRQNQAAAAGAISTLPSSMPGGADNASTTVGSTIPAPQSLQDWMAMVQKWGNSLGFDAAEIQNALQAYSLGNCLSSSQYKIIDQALSFFGQPPGAPYQGLVLCSPTAEPPGNTPPPPPPPVNNPPQPPQPPPNPVQPPQPPLPPIVTKIIQFFVGSGYGPGAGQDPVVKGQDGSYQWIPDAGAFNALPPGTTTYYQPSEGVFVPTYPGQGLLPGTPQFYKLGSIQPRNPQVVVPAMTHDPDLPVGGVVARANR